MTVLKTTQDFAGEFVRDGADPRFNSGPKLQLIAKRLLDIAVSSRLDMWSFPRSWWPLPWRSN